VDKHPFDWLIHFVFLAVFTTLNLMVSDNTIYAVLYTIAVGIVVSIMIEYEQWNLFWKSHYSDFTEYLLDFNITTGDLIADGLGIIIGVIAWGYQWV
jgi:glycopeptide antibiotics resistance protein